MKVFILPQELVGEPEVTAMLQAFYSRSSKSIEERRNEIKTVDVQKIKEKLATWYVGYGHDSIGELGNFALFLEDVSFLFAKAIQDNPLYAGTETSSRFLEFSSNRLVSPKFELEHFNVIAQAIQKSWFLFYEQHLPTIIKKLEEEYPHELFPDQKEDVWKKSIKARAFDIMRTFLPAGTTTQLSFYGSMRTIREHLSTLTVHPLKEIRDGCKEVLQLIASVYPNTFSKDKYNEDELSFLEKYSNEIIYSNPPLIKNLDQLDSSVQMFSRVISREWLCYDSKIHIEEVDYHEMPENVRQFLIDRPKGVKVPHKFGIYGTYKIKFTIDFGSYRDIQRHRNCTQLMPVLTNKLGMHKWHLEQIKKLDESVYEQACILINENNTLINGIVNEKNIYEMQNVLPLGMKVPVHMKMNLDEMIYVAELRSSKYVHPTLRPIAIEIGKYLKEKLHIQVYLDESEDAFNEKRGRQDIVQKL